MKRFKGIFTVMLNSYDPVGAVDRPAMEELTSFLIDSGVHGLVVLGSNGECPYLTRELQMDAIDTVLSAADGRVPVVVGINERGTEPAMELARYAEEAGADGLLVALPVFYQLQEDQVYRHYEQVCGCTRLPVLYYNYPSATGLTMAPQSIARLAGIDNLVGAKETIFDIEEVRALVEATDRDFCAFTGMCFNLVAAMEAGACGAICPLPNVAPRKTVELYDAIVAGEAEAASRLQGEVIALAPLMASSPTPHAMMKEALRLLGHPFSAIVKGPLPELTQQQADLARDTLKNAGMIQ